MRVQRRLGMSVAFMFVLLSACVGAFAQEATKDKTAAKPGDVIYVRQSAGQESGEGIRMPAPPGDDTLVFISSEMSFDGKVVKGAPYSGEAVTETTRTLGDGNRIKHKTTASVYRDGEGRTRREQELGAVGPWAMAGEPQQTVFINDPVAGVNYILDPRTHSARKMAPLTFRIGTPPGDTVVAAQGSGSKVSIRVDREVFTAAVPPPPAGEGGQVREFHLAPNAQKPTTESLGKQNIEGLEAEGTRTTMTIPAGEIGNEQPIQIVSERWYSPELQVVVMSRHTDPLVGETVYRLTNIVRGEPSRALFEVPADYSIKESPIQTRTFRRRPGNDEK
ncbi:MAG TPA: hypothetical protein VEV81_12585 [Pyrinomonadaceae bacterium]|nr:hypothetical protein [Pyrinomonadaceae bacterium]